MKIRTKLTILFLSLSLIPLGLIGAIAYRHGEQAIKQSLGESFHQIAHVTIEQIDRSVYDAHYKVRVWAGLELMQAVLTGDVDGKISSFLVALQTQYPEFASLYALNQDGEVVASSNPALIGRSFRGEEFFQRAIGGRAYLADVQFNEPDHAWVMTFAVPIHTPIGDPASGGVLCARWKASELSTMTQRRGVLDGRRRQSHPVLIRSDGLVIAGSAFTEGELFRQNLLTAGWRSARLASQRHEGYLVEREPGGPLCLIGYDYAKGYRDFPSLGWAVLVVEDAGLAFAPVQRLRVIIAGVGVLVALGVIILSFVVARQITTPLLKISQVAARVAQGDFEASVPHVSADEVGSLAATFNQMIEDLKHQRAQLVAKRYVESIISSISDALIAVDVHGKIRMANRAVCELLGYAQDELIGQPASVILGDRPPAASPGSSGGVWPQVGIRHEEYVYRAKSGKQIPVRLSTSTLLGQDGTVQGVVCVAQDITALKRTEEAMKQYMEELARSNAELQQFAYIASHDLQEPLRMVSGYVQLLARRYQGKLDAEAEEFIRYAVGGATRMQRLINDLLEYSRIGTRGKLLEPTDTAAVLDQALANLQVAIEESQAVITRSPLPVVLADGSQLIQLFQNLIGNAIKFRGDKPPRIQISAERGQGEWIFRVLDEGIGIEPQYTERIFVIFQRLHTAAEYPGTGIGLAICKKIVERHGGRIWVDSQLGQGATFAFSLPDRLLEPEGA